jgi:ERCC4-type nuclease
MLEPTPSSFCGLPALRSIGKLAGVEPVVVVDTREQTPLTFTRLRSELGTIQTGDYSFLGGEELFSVERKTIADLVGCSVGDNRARFERELHRIRGYRFKRLLVVGKRETIEKGGYQSKLAPKCVLGTLAALETRYDVPVVFADTPEEAAKRIESWVYWYAREMVEQVNQLTRSLGLTSNRTQKPTTTYD